jgi:hypothetical protein
MCLKIERTHIIIIATIAIITIGAAVVVTFKVHDGSTHTRAHTTATGAIQRAGKWERQP